MRSEIYIDPKIDMYCDDFVEILIEFKIKPAKVAMAIRHSDMTIEQANKEVETSHQLFRDELKRLAERRIKYSVIHTYKEAFNGVAMRIKGNTIKCLLQSTVIKAIYKNQEIELPKKPADTMYQI